MKSVEEIVEEILERDVRPKLAEHEGNVIMAEVRDGVAYVRLLGHCSGCPSAKYTLESLIKEEICEQTKLVKDVCLQEEVSQALIDFAKEILSKGRKMVEEPGA